MEEVLVGILFIAALVYIGRMLWKQYKAEDGCASGCTTCDPAHLKEPSKKS